jgi:hypothetical protein
LRFCLAGSLENHEDATSFGEIPDELFVAGLAEEKQRKRDTLRDLETAVPRLPGVMAGTIIAIESSVSHGRAADMLRSAIGLL